MLTLSLVLAGALVADTPKVPTAGDYVGRWNVRIEDAEDTFTGGGFDIRREGGKLTGGVVWRWGSFGPLQKAEVRDGTLYLVREEEAGKPDRFEARLEGNALSGQVTYPDGKVHHFKGRRAPKLDSEKTPVWGEPVSLFDGKTLDGWKLRDPSKTSGWAVVDGDLAVVEPKGNADLVSEKTFGDMKLHIEFNVDEHSNSGVYIRGRYEVQILDNPDREMALDSHGCGAVYSRLAPTTVATKPAGEWQSLDVEMVGRRISVTLNGTRIVQGLVEGITGGAVNPFEDEPGPLMLQGDHGKVRFRNIPVTPAR
jgi:hypothetical protein